MSLACELSLPNRHWLLKNKNSIFNLQRLSIPSQDNSSVLILDSTAETAIMKNSMEVPPKLKLELPHGIEIPLLAIYRKGIKSVC